MKNIFDYNSQEKVFHINSFEDGGKLALLFNDVLFNISLLPNYKKSIRVFIKTAVRDDLAFKLQRFDFRKDLENIFEQETNCKQFCIALNQIEKYSKNLSSYFTSKIINQWNEKFGNQILGYELYSFFGKYKSTPFGYHIDNENTFLLHIGPNPLTIYYSIENVNLEEINIFNITEIKNNKLTKKCILNSGDLIFIPKKIPHIIERKEFSITLGMIPYPIDTRWVIERYISPLIKSNLKNNNYNDNSKNDNNLDKLSCGLNNVFSNNDFVKIINDENNRLQSNGWLINTNVVSKENNSEYLTLTNKIILKEEENKFRLFISGKSISINKTNSILEFIETINCKKKVLKQDVREIFNKDFSIDATDKLILLFQDLL